MIALGEQISKWIAVFGASILFLSCNAVGQVPSEKSQEKPAAAPQEKPRQKTAEKTEEPPNAAQIELLETKYRFEANGDSRKEVRALVKINSELGVRQFARLNFDYNRRFQSVEIPLVHITHANGGTSDILPSAITDAPNPAVERFPAFHDVRVKSVRILGLQPGDSLEYRVETTTSKPPLAPDFWLDHSFDRVGVVTRETFQVDVPAGRVRTQINRETPVKIEKFGGGDSARESYVWDVEASKLKARDSANDPEDIAFTTFSSWSQLSNKLATTLVAGFATTIYLDAEALANTPGGQTSPKAWYNLIARKFPTVDLPFDMLQYISRDPHQILKSQYATSEEKTRLLGVLLTIPGVEKMTELAYSDSRRVEEELPRPSLLSGVLLEVVEGNRAYFLDPGLEVAPFGMIPAKLRGRKALKIGVSDRDASSPFIAIPHDIPFPASQRVKTVSSITLQGSLTSLVTYQLRGDNELLLRVAFHRTPAEKQKEIAQYLALSDGFRGKVTSVKTSDPYDTEKPFEVEYEITQEKFVDWSKKPVRIPALLPLPGLPEAGKKPAVGTNIELGPPLDIDLSGTLKLPAGTTAQAPVGTSVKRDYATFVSQYSAQQNVLHFSRHLNFISSQLPTERAIDLNAFLHAVQNDQALLFELDKPTSVPPANSK